MTMRILRYSFYIIAFAVLGLVSADFFGIVQVSNFLIGTSYIIIGLAFISINLGLFIDYGYKVNKKIPLDDAKDGDIFNYFDDDVLELMDNYVTLSKKYEIKAINLGIFVFALTTLTKGRYFLVRSGIFLNNDQEKLFMEKIAGQVSKNNLDQKNFWQMIRRSQELAVLGKRETVTFIDFVLALYEANPFFNHLLEESDIKEDALGNILAWVRRTFEEERKKYFWQEDYYIEGIGRNWASGYTPFLNLFSQDMTAYVQNANLEYQSKSRIDLISEMQDVLTKSDRNNIILVGDPGVGKKTLVYSLAQMISRGQTYRSLAYKHFVQLDIAKILGGVSGKSEIEARFNRIFGEVNHAGNIILFIDNLSTLLGGKAEEVGEIDASDYIAPYLDSAKVQIITTISYEDYKNKLQANTSLEELFNKIEVKELTKDEVIPSIEHLISFIEVKHKVIFTYKSVRHLVELADRYIHDRPFPQKAVDLLTELGVRNEKIGKCVIDIEDVDELIEQRVKIPVGKVKGKEKETLLNLEGKLHERVINQEEAITAVANALRRARAGLEKKNKPIGSFLFIGPTGVGKTETAKALAWAYYGSENNMIRFDMSEFQQISNINELLGSKVGTEFIPGRLTQGVKNNPFTLVLFDEIEKAHPNILNLFLQILDEGKITDGAGRSVDFTNTIIIATSNAGSEKIREYLNKGLSAKQLGDVIIDYLLTKGVFRPEFINRFDKVVCYKPLTVEQVIEVVKIMARKLGKTLTEKDIYFEITPDAIEKIAKEGYDPVFGARPLARLIQEKIENQIAVKMLSGELKKGGKIVITDKDI